MNKYSEERKHQQELGNVPVWMTTQGYQLFVEKYLHQKTVRAQYSLIAATAAKHVSHIWPEAEYKFFSLLWDGWLSPSTPVLANMGTTRGMPVSCSGGYISDSINGFYTARREAALLTKEGFGTSGYLGDIRCRGSAISVGGRASGVLPVFEGFVRDMQEVAQGTNRRGAWAGYLPIDHGDFDELCDLLHHQSDGLNVGWIITDDFKYKLDMRNEEATRRYQKALKVKMITGKGYFFKVDTVNRHRPPEYVKRGLDVKASNLCTEIMLHSSEDYTFTCVLSSMNVAKYDEWKNTDAVFWSTVFLDCVAQEFIDRSTYKSGLEKARDFTEKSRALGLGQCGLHTYMQSKGIPFESLEAQWMSNDIAKHIKENAMHASVVMGKELGIPEWCEDRRNTHLIAIAPTKSTALIMGGISEGINPDPGMLFSQNTSAGEVERITPIFLQLMKDRGVYDKKHIREIEDMFGSCQHVNWLSDHEKKVFKTAFEMDMRPLTRMTAARQFHVDQGQSFNFFFGADADEGYISECHQQAFENENILSLYYCYSQGGVSGSKNECSACQ